MHVPEYNKDTSTPCVAQVEKTQAAREAWRLEQKTKEDARSRPVDLGRLAAAALSAEGELAAWAKRTLASLQLRDAEYETTQTKKCRRNSKPL